MLELLTSALNVVLAALSFKPSEAKMLRKHLRNLRRIRRDLKRGRIDEEEYEALRSEILELLDQLSDQEKVQSKLDKYQDGDK